MGIILGKNLIVTLGNQAIAGARSCEITVNSDDIETSSQTQGSWREYIAGRKDWSVSTGHLLVAGSGQLQSESAMVGQTVTLRIVESGTQDVLTGTAIVKSWKASGTVDNLAQGSFSFKGSGALS